LVAAGANLERQAKPGDAPPPPTPPPGMTFKPPEAGGPTPLWIAATQKDLEMARLLLDGGASVDASCEPYPPLDAALLAGSGAIVDLLLERAKRRVNPLRLKVLTLHFASAEMFEICLDRGWMDQLAPAVVQDLEAKFAAQGRPDVIARYKARFG
ncbi:MAG TPA: ankyrin repeat domain-containing protein, partial [Byssovorax sp.]